MANTETALIVGAGPGLSASLARLFAAEGMQVAVAARNPDKLADLCSASGARAYACDATDTVQVDALFASVTADLGEPDIVVYNASGRARGPVQDLLPEAVHAALNVSCFGGFLVAQAAARQMIARNRGTILLTGASASVKGFANSSSFAMGKFALRGLAQSLARELHPQNVHVAHFVIDGGIQPGDEGDSEDRRLLADQIARDYLHVHRQHRSSWTWEMEVRPWQEKF